MVILLKQWYVREIALSLYVSFSFSHMHANSCPIHNKQHLNLKLHMLLFKHNNFMMFITWCKNLNSESILYIIFYLSNLYNINDYNRFYMDTHNISPMGFPGGASGKEPICQCRRRKRCEFHGWVRKIPESERGLGNPLQYSCLEEPMDGEPGRLWFIGSLMVGHNWSDFICNTHKTSPVSFVIKIPVSHFVDI